MAQAALAYRAAGKPTRFLDKVEDYWKDTPIRKITAGAIRQSAISLYPNAKPATQNRQVIVPTQAIINHAADLEWCSHIKVKRFKVATKTKEPVDLEWVTAFAQEATDRGLPHLAALCIFMFGTGARRGEACNLTWADVDISKREATIHQTKVEDTRMAHLPNVVVVALAKIGGNRNQDENVFQYFSGESVYKSWMNVAAGAGIKKLSPHSCRHGFATTMLRSGIDPKTVAKMGGWKDVATVMKHYAHAMDDPTITDVLFDTNLTQRVNYETVTIHKQKENKV